MATPLLQTKLYVPPPRPDLVPRPRLIERLDAGLHRKLTLISAPAGFGKTTLVSAWVQAVAGVSMPTAVAWLSLDESDNDLVRFLTYLIAALQTIEAGLGEGALGALRSPQPPPAEGILTAAINEVAALPDRIVLVLDDLHVIETRPIHDALSFLLRHQPPNLHLVIATRVDPPLPLARLRARGQLTELRAADLRFSAQEAGQFLSQTMGLDLPADDIAALERRTEGWIAGLQLAAISMQGLSRDGTPAATDFIEAFAGSHRYILDYLMEEVLEQQPPGVQAFLLQTSILDRLNGSLCDAVRSGSAGTPGSTEGTAEDSQTLLATLERANLFVVPLDGERHWYRYHRLFSDLLRRRLRRTRPDILPILHTRASEWYAHQGLHPEAIRYALAAGNFQAAIELIRSVAANTIQQGGHTTVLGWIARLPEATAKEHPDLSVAHAWALQLAGQPETAEALLTDAEEALTGPEHRDDEDVDTTLGLIHSRRAYAAFLAGDHGRTIALSSKALDRLPESSAWDRARTALLLGVSYRYRGQPRAALRVYREVLPVAQRMGSRSLVAWCCLHLGDLIAEMAQLHRARDVYEQALQPTDPTTGRCELAPCGYVHVGIGRIQRQWNQLEDALRSVTKGVALCRDWGMAELHALSCIELAHVHQALGQDEASRASIREAIRIMESFSPWGTKHATAHQARLNLARGDVGAAERWADSNDLATDGDYEHYREAEYLALIRVLIAQKRFEQAHALANRLTRTAQEIGKKQAELEGLVLLALVLSLQGDVDQGSANLIQALSIAEPEGYVRIFVDEGPPMARLLLEALGRGIAPEYIRHLLAAFPSVEPEETTPAPAQDRSSELIEPLSDREIEVLRLIAEGLTNRDIAARLYLSPHTIKVHARSIYGKLGVHSRVAAVARGRALGILPST